jgi:hypothetical protein
MHCAENHSAHQTTGSSRCVAFEHTWFTSEKAGPTEKVSRVFKGQVGLGSEEKSESASGRSMEQKPRGRLPPGRRRRPPQASARVCRIAAASALFQSSRTLGRLIGWHEAVYVSASIRLTDTTPNPNLHVLMPSKRIYAVWRCGRPASPTVSWTYQGPCSGSTSFTGQRVHH